MNQNLSFIIPVFNEQDSISLLVEGILTASNNATDGSVEILLVDDGSTDGSWKVIENCARSNPGIVRGIHLRKNFGKSTALSVGFEHASGDIVFTMDADLQDDPDEIPRFVQKIAEGYDVVSGWKENRQDPPSKTIPSRFFNAVTRWVTGVKLHDFNCGFKAYRKEVIKSFSLYGELHRYIPALVHDLGFSIGEMSVHHHPRKFGVSKYGWKRYVEGFLDLMTVVATTRYLNKPAHLFGGLGVLTGTVGMGILSYLTVLWFIGHRPIGNRPLLFLGMLCVILAAQLLSLGVLAEVLNRKTAPKSNSHLVGQVINIPAGSQIPAKV